MNFRRVGKFYISKNIVESSKDRIIPLFKDLLVLSAYYDYVTDAFEYVVTGDYLPEIENGSQVPKYMLKLDTVKNVYYIDLPTTVYIIAKSYEYAKNFAKNSSIENFTYVHTYEQLRGLLNYKFIIADYCDIDSRIFQELYTAVKFGRAKLYDGTN